MKVEFTPIDVIELVTHIEAMLAEARQFCSKTDVSVQIAFNIRETSERYLPDTLKAYVSISMVNRTVEHHQELISQLTRLARATSEVLVVLREQNSNGLKMNGDFLTARFPDVW